ncbi:MAG TPA: cyclic nucleotide-binding domain-containing protein [Thiotrichaceae bacterium]|nr:cyclic nucleotide-binding domain-containing protein [Thiotrichaceae bacterium]
MFEEGDVGHSMYVIKSGAMRVLTTEGQPIMLATLNTGECFGEQAILAGRTEDKRHISVVAAEPTELLKIAFADFRAVVPQQSGFESQLRQINKDKIRREGKSRPKRAPHCLAVWNGWRKNTLKRGKLFLEKGMLANRFF